MPASNERIPNRPLSGEELSKIIQRRVGEILSKDGMFLPRIAYSRASYEVRITLHLDNPSYPSHVTVVLPELLSNKKKEQDPVSAQVEGRPPLNGELTDEAILISTELTENIRSPNAARIENDLPLKMIVHDPKLGMVEKDVLYKGDLVQPALVGNILEVRETTDEEAARLKVPKSSKKGK
ncbi:MAG: hypothetical protein ACREJN_21595 [Nitrospiraceae bacterium]